MQAIADEAGNHGAWRGIVLPAAPPHLAGPVKAWREDVQILTYLPSAPDTNPMFLEKRVYQGSSGRVYPLPFIDRIATEPTVKTWQAIHLENEYLRLMILPEIGGRIHIGYDKTTGYDFFYRQNVIKPALVGLAGPWISGGVEFNWPQHHRPATFMPVETHIEDSADGSVTVWCSDHDPMLRMKGMHGICLQPDRAALDLKVRLYNRTPFLQTFLWWANVAVRVHEQYQSFFPTDVRFVADHARRAITSFPLSDGLYYGVNYGERGLTGVPAAEQPSHFVPDGSYAANDLSWYANIPVPTSYMVTGTSQDFFGGYDHGRAAGVVHVANHHIAPGKKQWTWGNHEFGYAWDRSLTDSDGPYIELMAGVYTDNQPDFSYLAPWETKTFTQCWYPIHHIGPPQLANAQAAVSLRVIDGLAHLGVHVTSAKPHATVRVLAGDVEVYRSHQHLTVQDPLQASFALPSNGTANNLRVLVESDGQAVLDYDPASIAPASSPSIATEPPQPEEIGTIDELYLTGVHLTQYRHATRQPELYWQQGLRRDPGESRCNNALGLWHLHRGELEAAAAHFDAAIRRITALNPNPRDGEPFYNLGITRRYQRRNAEAYDAFYKATWNAAWRGPAYLALAELDCCKQEWSKAVDHLRRSLKSEADNLLACNLLAVALERSGDNNGAAAIRNHVFSLDPLEIFARWQRGDALADNQQRLDLALDLERAGLLAEAAEVLRGADLAAHDGSVPMVLFTLAAVERRLGLPVANSTLARAAEAPLALSFPSRLEELFLLQETLARQPDCGAAAYLLGNLLYNLRRHPEAIAAWESASRLLPNFPTVWRNLSIAYWNVSGAKEAAMQAMEQAFRANPADARLLYERDQLWKRLGIPMAQRLAEFEEHPALVSQRDDLCVELATLLNQAGRPQQALSLLLARNFQPWEGGEGLVLGQYVRAHLKLGQAALRTGDAEAAHAHFAAALEPPRNLGEARHLLANQSDIFYWLGVACRGLGDADAANHWWSKATEKLGDFQQMAVQSISDMTWWSGLAEQQLGNPAAAERIFHSIETYATELEASVPKIPYFATSLPTMLLFHEDQGLRNTIEARYLRAQAAAGLGRAQDAQTLLGQVLAMDAHHAGALDLLEQLGPQK